MKKKLLIGLMTLFSTSQLWAADGDSFTAETVEGVTMKFQVISEAEKTCMVQDGYYTLQATYIPSISKKTTGPITIPSKVNLYTVTAIGKNAFNGCSGLTSVTIPSSVTSIGSGAFYVCKGLTSVYISDLEAWCKIAFNGYDSNPLYYANHLFLDEEVIKDLVIPSNITSIGDCTFSGCSGFTSITIPNSVTTIGGNAFRDCSGLTSVTIPNSVISIGRYAFRGTRLKTFIVGTGLLTIASDAFESDNRPIKTIWLTNTPPTNYTVAQGTVNYVANSQYGSLNNIKEYKFLSSMFDVDGVKYVPVSPSDRTCDAIDCIYDETMTEPNINATVTYNGINMKVLNVLPYTFYENSNLQKVCFDIAGGIGKYVFYGCKNLKSAVFGKDITGIDEYAFSGCTALESIIVPDSVKAIGQYAFSGCSGMTLATIGNKTETIGQYAFSGCSSLPNITIPGSVTHINNYAFTGCNRLKEVILADREDDGNLSLGSNGNNPLFDDCPLDSVYIGRNIAYQKGSNYGYSPFYRNTSLRSVMITDMEEEISENEFYGCTSLQNVEIGDGITEIGNRAFSGCASLQHFGFGTQVKSIGAEAFSDCTALTAIISKAATPPVCGSQALDDVNKWSCTLTVPKGSVEAYQSADQWKDFFFVEEDDEGGSTPIDPSDKKCATPTISYTASKLTFSSETEGTEFVYEITDQDIKKGYEAEVQLTVTYNISVYATKDGYADSDVATATLCWIDVEPNTEGIDGGAASVRALPVLIQSHDGVLTIEGATEGTPISVYNFAGQLVGTATATTGTTTVNTTLHGGNVGIVRIGDRAVKVTVK